MRPTWVGLRLWPATIAWVGVDAGGGRIIENVSVSDVADTSRHLRPEGQTVPGADLAIFEDDVLRRDPRVPAEPVGTTLHAKHIVI